MSRILRVTRALGTGMAAYLGLVFLLALIETLAGPLIEPGPRRGGVMLALGLLVPILVAAGVLLRRRTVREKPDPKLDAAAKEALRRLAEMSEVWRNPPTEPRGTPAGEALRLAAHECLALRHVFPPRYPQLSLSALGGLPIAPPDFEYPETYDRDGTRTGLSFMAQIDCAALPAGPARNLLPEDGYLYFFAPNFSDFSESPYRNCVCHVPGAAQPDWGPREPAPPAVLKPLADAEYSQKWTNWHPQPKTLQPCVSPRIEIELGWVAHAASPESCDATDFDLQDKHDRASLLAFHGAPVAHDPVLTGWNQGEDLPFSPFEGFPTNRYAAEILIGHLRVLLRSDLQEIEKRAAILPPDDDAIVRLNETASARVALEAHLATLRFAQPLPRERAQELSEAERDEVIALFHQVQAELPVATLFQNPTSERVREAQLRRRRQALTSNAAEAAALSAELALGDPATANRIPAGYVEKLRYYHTPLKGDRFGDNGGYHKHQMLGVGRDIQGAVGYHAPSHIMLMQFSPDDALDWHFGDVGVLQYWITPADLEDRRFQNAFATFECH